MARWEPVVVLPGSPYGISVLEEGSEFDGTAPSQSGGVDVGTRDWSGREWKCDRSNLDMW